MRLSITAGLVAFALAATAFYASSVGEIDALGRAQFYLGIARSSFFAGLAVGGSVYAIRCGGEPERVVGIAILATVLADPLLHLVLNVRFASVDPTHLIIDFVRLATFTFVALRANRFWPIWLAALQLLALGAHLTREMEVAIHPVVYAAMKAIWTYGMLALLIAATRYHQRLIERGVMRKSWSTFSRPVQRGALPPRA